MLVSWVEHVGCDDGFRQVYVVFRYERMAAVEVDYLPHFYVPSFYFSLIV